MAAGPVTHSVYGMGVTKASPPDFGALSKQTATVDVDRLQTELRALHGRLEMLEVVALAAAEEKEKELDFDKDVGSSGVRIAVGTEGGEEEDEEEKGTPRTVDGASRGEMGLTEEMAGRCVDVVSYEFHICLVLPPSMRVIQFPCAEQGCMS